MLVMSGRVCIVIIEPVDSIYRNSADTQYNYNTKKSQILKTLNFIAANHSSSCVFMTNKTPSDVINHRKISFLFLHVQNWSRDNNFWTGTTCWVLLDVVWTVWLLFCELCKKWHTVEYVIRAHHVSSTHPPIHIKVLAKCWKGMCWGPTHYRCTEH